MFELEADCTIPAEYILMMHYMDEIDPVLQTKIANFLRGQKKPDGSYPLYKGGVAKANVFTRPCVRIVVALGKPNVRMTHL